MIDFGTPFDTAFRRVKEILFRPFSFGKWIVIAFTVWMAQAFQSGGGNSWQYLLNNNSSNSTSQHHASSFSPHQFFHQPLAALAQTGSSPVNVQAFSPNVHNDAFSNLMLKLGIGFGVTIVVAILLLVLVFVWLSMRGKFMFLDNVVNNRAEVRDPWRKFRTQGNSLFVFSILVGLGVFVFVALGGISTFLAFRHENMQQMGVGFWVAIGFALLILFCLYLVLGITWFLYMEFGVPIMYCTGCLPKEAFGRVWRLIKAHPLDAFVYTIIRIAMEILFFFIRIIVGILTCCLACILPFVTTALTLPLPIFRQCFTLDCLVQLDPQYDAWRMVTRSVLPPEPLKSGEDRY
ncbi:MAG: hypothetical protein ABI443_11205 [Chthoniobacterales bacterium]